MRKRKDKGIKRGKLSGKIALALVCLIFLTLAGLPFSGSFLSIQEADAGDMVTNGVFNGTSPWILSTPTYDAALTRTGGSGSVTLHAEGRNIQVTGTLEQPVSISAGQSVSSSSLYTRLVTTNEGTVDNVVMAMVYTDDTTVNLLTTPELTNSTVWTQRTGGTVNLTKDVKAIRITMNVKSGASNGATADLWIDEVSITVNYNPTITGSANATAASATSLTLTMPYTFDDNNNNSCTTRYKLSNETTWTVDAAACSDSGTALTKTISGLTEGGYYDVEVTYVDPDTVEGTNPQTVYNVLLGPTNKTSAGLVTIRVLVNLAGDSEILLRMPFENDGNDSSTYTINYKLSSSGSWTNFVTAAPHTTSGIYKATITGLTIDERYDIQAIYNDTDGVAGYGGTQTYTNVLMNPTMHNSYNYSMRKWGGKWGVSGGQYGEFVCTTCHERFPTNNIKRIKDSGPITAPDTSNGNFPGSGTTVVFTSAQDGSSDFGNDTTAHATSNRICEVCHSVPEYHKYNQPVAAQHFNLADCMQCHNHATGFYPAGGQCTNCHSQAQNQMYNTRQVTGAGGDFVRLSRHVSNGTATEIVTNYDCAICHREADADIIAAGEGWLDLYTHKNGSSQLTRSVMLRNVDDMNAGWKFNKYSTTEQMRSDMDNFCLACHDDNGALDIAVNNTDDGLLIGSAETTTTLRGGGQSANLRPFNSNDTLQNGRDGLTTRTRVIDVKNQFNPGTYKWNTDGSMPGAFTGANYDGLPSQHNVLGPRYKDITSTPWPSSTWTGHTTRYGQIMSTARETARLHCSDCHLNETNAHGASNSWHMLLNSALGDFTSDTAPIADDDSYVVCYKCHNITDYADVPSTAARWSHDRDGNAWGKSYGVDGAFLGPNCLLCHGGDGFGHIHGRGSSTDGDGNNTFNSTYTPAGGTGTYTKQRFMPGAWMQWKPSNNNPGDDTDWNTTTTAANCYFPSSESWSNCSHHSGGTGGTSSTNYGRATKY